jgi:hypothetical protein
MKNRLLKRIEDAIFRANPAYELLPADRLSPTLEQLLGNLPRDPDFYGILRPRTMGGLGMKSIGRDTALLYSTLVEPGPLPAEIRTLLGDQCNQAVAELVLDGVLEIAQGRGFVSGVRAYGLIFDDAVPLTGRGTIARLSVEALQYGQALDLLDSTQLSLRLYCYNRRPASPQWRQRLPTPSAVEEYLGIQQGGSNRAMLDRYWTRAPPQPPYDGWLSWRARYTQPVAGPDGLTYKLYVSPSCEALTEAFHIMLGVLTETDAPVFKIGKDIYGLLRPDKFIAYFPSWEALQEAAARLGQRLKGCPAQAVPFTAALQDDGLLSWGRDPGRDPQSGAWPGRESWRLWVTNRLAVALLAAKAALDAGAEPWQFAMRRLQVEGVDTTTWTPAADMLWRATPPVEV